MKNIIITFCCLCALLLIYLNLNGITSSLANFIIMQEPVTLEDISEYKKDDTLSFVSNTDTFIPYSEGDLLDLLFTTINNRWTNFTFYCPSEYSNCQEDISTLYNDSNTLSHVNNFTHPYNSFTNIKVTISENGMVNLNLDYLYSEDVIKKIDNRVDELITELIPADISDYDKIKTIHDYIINNTKYDVAINKNEKSIYNSDIAYGPLFEGYAICNGYTDLMAIFLTKFGITNIKVATTPEDISYSTTGHIWNAVNLNGEWLHIDLTWDDPVSDNGIDYLFHNYFLIDTKTLIDNDNKDVKFEEHLFNESIYYELRSK